jgi:hypothetical protein
MGFFIPFTGWYLFVEILTILAYFIDIFYIYRHLRNLKLHSYVATVPTDTLMTTQSDNNIDKKVSHDLDEVESKLSKMRFDLFTSILATFPFSLIFNDYKK